MIVTTPKEDFDRNIECRDKSGSGSYLPVR